MSTIFRINEYLELRLEDGRTNLYVDGIFYNYCKYLLLNIPVDKVESYDTIESIDEMEPYLDHSLEPREDGEPEMNIAPHVEFWGHCSNLQVWYEYDYDSRLIHRNLAFWLLKELTEAGDAKACRAFKREIASRLESRYLPVTIYLLEEGYLEYLTYDEVAAIKFDRIDTLYDLVAEYYELSDDGGVSYKIDLSVIYEYAKTLVPRTAGEWYRKAILYNILEMPEEEYRCLQTALKKYPNNVDFMTALLNKEYERDNMNEVRRISRLFTRIEPNEPSFWLGAGIFYLQGKNFEKAISCFQKGIQLDPDNQKLIIQLELAAQKAEEIKKIAV